MVELPTLGKIFSPGTRDAISKTLMGPTYTRKMLDLNKQVENINKQMDKLAALNTRTVLDLMDTMGGDDIRIPYYPMDTRHMYDLSLYCDVIRTIKHALRKGIFRNGIELQQAFAKKCIDCGEEMDQPEIKCNKCGSINLRDPDQEQKNLYEAYLECANENEQKLIQVYESINDDEDTIDEGYLCARKDYYFDQITKEILYSKVREFVRIHPLKINLICDDTGRPGRNREGKIVYTCVEHRDKMVVEDSTTGYCSRCHRRLYQAFYKGEAWDGKDIFYIYGEICHKSKYNPSLTYGFPPILSVWLKASTLMAQDRYVHKYYNKERPPRGLMFVRTANNDSLQESWKWMLEQWKINPHLIPPIAVNSEGAGDNFVQFIDFMRSLDEMQFTEMRNEYRTAIGAVYQVMPIFQGDVKTSGGLNSEGLQITVTGGAITDGQGLFNDDYSPWVEKQLNITDWHAVLRKNETQDDMKEAELFGKKAENAKVMQDMGFDVTLNEDNEFEFSPIDMPVEKPVEPSPFGAFGSDIPPGPGGSGGSGAPNTSFQGQPGPLPESPLPRSPLKSLEKEGEGGVVTSETEGVYGPAYGRSKKRLVDFLQKELQNVAKELEVDYDVNKAGEGQDELAEIMTKSLFDTSFKGVTKSASEKIKEFIVKALLKGYKMEQIQKYILRTGGSNMSKIQAEMIARTEGQALRLAAREYAYSKVDPEQKMNYRWVGPQDHRTTSLCSNIKKRTQGGVPLDELKKIIEEEVDAAKDRGEISKSFEARTWTPHINCRHTFIKHYD